ncbi:MAG: BatA domain-containing protein [Myxococcaceae bacterium]
MTFAHPWMLLGGLAALIPLLVHLFDRRRPRPQPFGAISFVLKSQRRTASRLRLKRLLLYVLRTLIFLALPFALARPEWRRETTAIAAHGPAATAIVLDTSLSLRWTDGNSLFDKARDEAREALRDLLPEEPATVMLCGPGAAPPAAPGFERGRLRTQIDDAKVTYGTAEMTRCMELAAQALEETLLPGKRVVLISDFTTNAFRLETPPPTVKGPNGQPVRPEVVLRDAAQGHAALPNRAIVDLHLEPALQVGPRAFQFAFTVRNFSNEAVKDLEASLKVNGQVVSKGFLDIPAGGSVQKTLTHTFPAGGLVQGELSLSADALAEDDRRSFVLAVPRELRALVVNGSPHATRYRDEAFFVDAALSAPGSPVREATRDPEAAFREDFASYDLLLLLNVAAPPADVAAKLVEFVKKGGGLFISVGDNVEADAYNQRFGEVLPRPLRLVKTAVPPEDADAEAKAAKLTQISNDHPVLSPFSGRAREGLMSSRFFRYMLLEGEHVGPNDTSQVLATFDDGAPALAVSRKGAGRVLLFTSTVDRDWSDFAIRTSFLPLMQRFSAYLTGSLEERDELRGKVGDLITLRPDVNVRVGEVKAPDGESVSVRAQQDGTFLVGPLTQPGVHPVLDASGTAIPSMAIVAVLDPSESDLTRVQEDQLSAYFGEETVKSADAASAQPKLPLWTWLICVAAIAFFLEGLLLRS